MAKDKKKLGKANLKITLRRERIKKKILTGGWTTIKEMAAEEGVGPDTISDDLRALEQAGIVEQAKEATKTAYLSYCADIDWATEEAKQIHNSAKELGDDGELHGGRVDCLNFLTKTRKEQLEMAQKLGLLEIAVEKQEHTVHIDMDDPELIRQFGDFVATQSSKEED